ncbi:hypothetical protein NQ176_g3081 [Zarea fungicola]|uniref:Uncharacterized protein n=1 Tax=Zarea fungicola TaxID=93591 RepID=A0ACC1NKX6_9HYPO|nr:hypothetical protein NQ176_g3081 [Lecanicillium fungicola]
MALYQVISTLLSVVAVANAASLPRASDLGASSDASTTLARTVYQFANGSWVENIAARANGNLLVTRSDTPELYEIDPRKQHSARLIHHFDGYQNLLGISETSKDVFAVVAGNVSLTTGGTPASFAIWKVSLEDYGNAQVAKVTSIPDAIFLNGMTALQPGTNAVLVSDCSQGVVYRVNVVTGKYSVVLRDATFQPPPNAPLPIGVNGIRLHGQSLYYANTFKQLFGHIPIDTRTGAATGAAVAKGTAFPVDDFAIDTYGNAFVAAGTINEVFKILPNGDTELVAGNTNSELVEGATSAVFGRTWADKRVLYVTTSGGQASILNGLSTEGGKVVAFHV